MTKRTPGEAKCWMPMSKEGELWVCWAEPSKRRCVQELNASHVGWRRDGFRVVRCAVKRIKQRAKR